jgi:hypothetical protein
VLISPLFAGVIFLVSVLLGLIRPNAVLQAVRLMDRHYHLKDRILTATALLRRKHRTSMEQLQIDDTAEYLAAIRPHAVYPIRFPKMFWLAFGVFAMDAAVLAIIHGGWFPPVGGAAESTPHVALVEDTAMLEEIATQTEELMQTHASEPAIQKLSEQLETLLDQLDWTTMGVKDSLATLSAMEDAFQAALDSLQLETMDESLLELAQTLELAEKTLPISKALEKGDYSLAASELKKLDSEMFDSLSPPERKALAEQMQSLANNAEKRNQKPLQEAAQKMSEALENNDGDQCKAAADALANEVEQHGVRQGIGKDLASQQMALGMMKAENGLGNMSGGKGTDKSETASQTWGGGSAGNPNAGEETSLQGERQQQVLTGMLSEQGNSITETVESQEITAAQSQLQYREHHQQYQKISEAVLDSEPIPLGQRQIIRRYFEAIRP